MSISPLDLLLGGAVLAYVARSTGQVKKAPPTEIEAAQNRDPDYVRYATYAYRPLRVGFIDNHTLVTMRQSGILDEVHGEVSAYLANTVKIKQAYVPPGVVVKSSKYSKPIRSSPLDRTAPLIAGGYSLVSYA